MKKYIIAIIVLLSISGPAFAARDVLVTKSFSTSGTEKIEWYYAPQIQALRYHVITWTISGGALSACNVKLQKSFDGTTKADLIANQTCTANGASVVTADSTAHLWLTTSGMTTDTSAPVLTVSYVGYVDNPSIAVSNLATDDAVGAAITVNPVVIAGKDDSSKVIIPYLDPCQTSAKAYVPISQAATGPLAIIIHTDNLKTYVCSVLLVTNTAQNINLIEGTGSNCATGAAGLLGGADAATGLNLDAKSGAALGNGGFSFAATAAASADVCLVSSSTGQISGVLTYVKR